MTIEIAMLIMACLGIIFLTAFLSCIDTAIMLVDEVKMNVLLDNDTLSDKTRLRLIKISEKRDRHMTAMTVFMTFIGIATSTYLGVYAYANLSHTGVLVYLILITYGNLVFARTFPKVIARNHYEKILIKCAWLIRLIYCLAMPMVLLTLIWVRLFKLDRAKKMNINELKSTIKYYHSKGLLEQSEASLLQNVFMIKQFDVKKLFTPTPLPMLPYDADISECKDMAIEFPGRRFITQDVIAGIGVVYYRDLASKLIAGDEAKVSEVARPSIVVNETECLIDILVKMKTAKVGQVVVAGESGELLGVVSAKEMYSHILANSIEKPLSKIK